MKSFWCILGLLSTLVVSGAEPSGASTDWREWYYPTNRVRWTAKTDPQLRAEAKSGNAVAMYALAKRIYGERDRDRYPEARSLMAEAAKAGLSQAIESTALDIRGDSPGDQRARFELFEKAAATGYPPALVWVAQILQAGKLFRPDPERSLQLMRAAADAGDTQGHFLLAMMYSTGVGEPRGPDDKPIYHIKSAANGGDGSAMNELARRYRLGYTVPKDFLRSVAIFVESASQAYGEFSDAGFRLNATALDADEFNHVVDLFVAALIRSDGKALAALGEMHARGDHGQTNLVRAAALFELAAANGQKVSAQQRDRLWSNLTPDQKSAFRDEVKWMKSLLPSPVDK
jgi:TPR repeat protein